MEDKKITRNILIISAVVIALCIGIGFSFAYFTANVNGNEDAKENVVKAGKMEITYIDGSSISLDKMQPGESTTKKFKVQNTGNFSAKYNIKLDEVNNTLQDKTDLRYTLKKNGSEVQSGVVPSGSAYILTDISIDATETPDEYELKIEFVDTHTNQNDNQGKTYTGKIQIDKEENITLATNPDVKLYQGMIPVEFDGNGNVIVADTNDKWYDYTVQKWANAVLVDASNETIKDKYFNADNTLKSGIANKIIPMDEILQMYVYIPRYKYQLWNVNNEGVPKQLINVQFEDGTANTGDIQCTYTDNKDGTVTEDCTNKDTGEPAKNGEWYTHPAFTFGETELPGIWVGKFEPSDPTDPNGRLRDQINEITILPDKTSMGRKTISTMFNAERAIETNSKYNLNSNEVDTHIAKNIEWGAVAYLTQSVYGIYKDDKTCNIDGMDFTTCEVWINNTSQGAGTTGVTNIYGGTYTGCVGDSVSAEVIWNADDGSVAKCVEENRWNEKGINASTTGNMYGVYDMAGGAWDYVMAAIVNEKDGGLFLTDSGFTTEAGKANTLPESKYYDMYTFSDDPLTHWRGHLGDFTREALQTFGIWEGGWNADYTHFPEVSSSGARPWFLRGGTYDNASHSGVFVFSHARGGAGENYSFRSVLTAE